MFYGLRKSVFLVLSLVVLAVSAKTYNLEECIIIGEKNNLDLKSLGYDIESSNLSVTSARNNFYDIKASAVAREATSETDNFNNLGSTISSTTSSLNSDLGVNFYLSLGLINSYEQSKLSEENSSITYNNELKNLQYNITQSFFQVLISKEDLNVKNEKIKYSQLHYDETKMKYDLGNLTKSDLLQAEVSLSQAKLDIIRAKSSLSSKKQSLIQLINLDEESSTFKVKYDFSKIANDELDQKQLIANALKNRIDLKVSENNLQLSTLSLKSAKSTYFPSIGAGVNGNYSYNFKDSYSSNSYGGNVNLTWDLSFSDFNSIDKAKVNEMKSALRVEQKKHDIINEVKQNYLSFINEKENLKRIDKHVELAHQNLELANEMFKLGNKTITEQISAKNSYIDAMYQKIYAKYQYLITFAKLMNSTGK